MMEAMETGDGYPALSAKRLDKWTIMGIGGGSGTNRLAISPLDHNRILANSGLTACYISLDGGQSWRSFFLHREARFFVWDPLNADIAYAFTNALYRTADCGKTWELVHPDPSIIAGIIDVSDDAETIFVRQDAGRSTVQALGIDPGDSRILHIVVTRNDGFSLWTSTDWGKTLKFDTNLPWGQQISVLASGGRKIYVDPRSPTDNRTIYVIGDCQVSVREDGQWKHHYPPGGVHGFTEAALGFPKDGGKAVIYAITELFRKGRTITGGLFISTDGGESWRTGNGPIIRWTGRSAAMPNLRAIATCVNDPSVAYLSIDHLQMDGETNPVYGIARTADGGRTWDLKIRETDPEPSKRVKDAWLNDFYGPEWGENPMSLCVSASDPNTVYTGDLGRVMKSTDGLDTLEAAYSRKQPDGTFSTTGIDVITCYGLHFDPFDPRHVILSCASHSVLHSYNGGASWTKYALPRSWPITTYSLAFDDKVKGRGWAAFSSARILPRPQSWRGIGAGHFTGFVALTEDGGKTWTKASAGMAPTAVTHVIVDPHSSKDARVLYAAGFGTGVWKSGNGGKTWTLKNTGIKGRTPFAWRLADDCHGALYLVVARRSEMGVIGNDDDGALYKSVDGGESWQNVPLPAGVNGPNGLAVDPRDPQRMYLAVWGLERATGDIGGGIYLTTDGGRSWRNVEYRRQHVYAITIDPRNPSILYASSYNASVLRSTDRGETWSRLKGFNAKWSHWVTCDPTDPDTIFVTTYGSSVWRGPSAGDPDALEDIVTPDVRYDR